MPPEQSELLANRLQEAGVPTELPGARRGFDGAWGGWSLQIVGHELEGFLQHRLGHQNSDAR